MSQELEQIKTDLANQATIIGQIVTLVQNQTTLITSLQTSIANGASPEELKAVADQLEANNATATGILPPVQS